MTGVARVTGKARPASATAGTLKKDGHRDRVHQGAGPPGLADPHRDPGPALVASLRTRPPPTSRTLSVNVRAKASTSSAILGQLPKARPSRCRRRQGRLAPIKYAGKTATPGPSTSRSTPPRHRDHQRTGRQEDRNQEEHLVRATAVPDSEVTATLPRSPSYALPDSPPAPSQVNLNDASVGAHRPLSKATDTPDVVARHRTTAKLALRATVRQCQESRHHQNLIVGTTGIHNGGYTVITPEGSAGWSPGT